MRKFIISTDNTADFEEEYLKTHGIDVFFLSYTIDEVSYEKGNELPYKEFYDKMRNGSMPITSQINPVNAKAELQKLLEQKKDILYISFSSGLSGSYNSVRMAAEELLEEGVKQKIKVVDSLSASLGEGLLVYKAVQMMEEGKTLDETVQWVEEHKLNMCHIFTVDDLYNLYRGGRVSKATAVLGTIVNVKPILHVDKEGFLIPIGKVRGRKKSLQELVNRMEDKIGSYRNKNDIIFISHGDCKEDAEYVAELVRQKFGIKQFYIAPIGPTIGTHAGPGTVALFFMGDER